MRHIIYDTKVYSIQHIRVKQNLNCLNFQPINFAKCSSLWVIDWQAYLGNFISRMGLKGAQFVCVFCCCWPFSFVWLPLNGLHVPLQPISQNKTFVCILFGGFRSDALIEISINKTLFKMQSGLMNTRIFNGILHTYQSYIIPAKFLVAENWIIFSL
jgi:hypothetical protein